MVRGKNRIPYWIDRRLTGLAEPEYDATISFGLPFESEDSQYGKYRLRVLPGSYVGIMRDHKREVPAAPFDRCDTAPADQCGLSDHDRNALKAIYQGHSRH